MYPASHTAHLSAGKSETSLILVLMFFKYIEKKKNNNNIMCKYI